MSKVRTKVLAAKKKFQPFIDVNSWILIIIGLVIFSLRVQFTPGGWINLPVMFTVLQTAGLMLTIAGIQIMASRAFWPSLSLGDLLLIIKGEYIRKNEQEMSWKTRPDPNGVGAGLVIAGLLIFNGLCMLASVMWLTSALGAGIVGS